MRVCRFVYGRPKKFAIYCYCDEKPSLLVIKSYNKSNTKKNFLNLTFEWNSYDTECSE